MIAIATSPGAVCAIDRTDAPRMARSGRLLRDNMMGGFMQWILLFGSSKLMTETMPKAITGVVTGNESSPAREVDKGFAEMQVTFAFMDGLGASNGGRDQFVDQLGKVTTMSAIGTAGPAIIGGALLLMYKAALGLFVGFGPLFIFALLFQSTKQLFTKWLYYGIGTMFSLAVLSFMVAVAMKLVVAVSVAMLAKYTLIMGGTGAAQGMNSVAMQQGGLGLILSILLITVPPMAAQFFQGTMGGAFSQYSMFGNTGGGSATRDSAGNVMNPGTQRAPSHYDTKGGNPTAQTISPYGSTKLATGYQESIQEPSNQIPKKQLKVDGEPR